MHTKHSAKAYVWGGIDSDGTDTHKVFCPVCGLELGRGKFVIAMDIPDERGALRRYVLARKTPVVHCGALVPMPRFFYCRDEAAPALESVEERLVLTGGSIPHMGIDMMMCRPQAVVCR